MILKYSEPNNRKEKFSCPVGVPSLRLCHITALQHLAPVGVPLRNVAAAVWSSTNGSKHLTSFIKKCCQQRHLPKSRRNNLLTYKR